MTKLRKNVELLKQVKKYPELSLCWTKWQQMSDSFAATVYKVEGMY